jgi:DNA-directed RNA polymerase subunit M/transcription elongation factor TFIIS
VPLYADSKKYVFEESHVFDPTLSLTEVTCPECGHNRAIYTLAADEDETKFVARMMCANVQGTTIKCCHTWELDEFDDLNEGVVVVSSEKEHENELM